MVFMDYETLRDICKTPMENNEYIRIYYKDLNDDSAFIQTVKSIMGTPYYINSIESTVKNISNVIKWFTFLLYLILIIGYIIACIFIRSRVDIDLFYRKLEIGFLQIFKLKKVLIKKMIIYEYLFQVIRVFLYSLIIYFVLVVITSITLGKFFIFNPSHIFPMLIIIFGIYVLFISRAINQFLRKDILQLIT